MKKTLLLLVLLAAALTGMVWISLDARHAAELARRARESTDAKREQFERRLAAERAAAPKTAIPAHPKNPTVAAWAKLKADPDLQAMNLKVMKGHVHEFYSSVYRALKLSPEQIEAFENLVVAHQAEVQDLAMEAVSQGLNPRTDPRVKAAIQQTQTALQASETELLGTDGAQQVAQADAAAPAYYFARNLASNVTWATDPMTGEQIDQVAAILAKATPLPVTNGPPAYSQADLAAALQQAQAVLTPGQLAVMQSLAQGSQFSAQEQAFFKQNGLLPAAPSH